MEPVQRIYLDANATTPVLPEVVAAMQPYWTERFGNASAVHGHGQRARAAIDRAREQVADLIGARANEVVFTSGGTESDNLALTGTLSAGDHMVTTAIEHHAVLHAAENQSRQRGVALTVVSPGADGVVTAAAVQAAVRPQTKLVSVMLANNETGVLQPVREIARVVHDAGALLHTDAVQAAGKIAIDVRDLDCDLLTISAHKMHGPQGAGALWVRKGVEVAPLLFGGPQERRRRAGTENLPALVGFGEAAFAAREWLEHDGRAQLRQMREAMEEALLAAIPGAVVHGAGRLRLPNTTSLQLPEGDSEALVIALDLQGVAISGGAACQSGAVEPSHVLTAMGLTPAEARRTLRISLSRLNTADEVAEAVRRICAAVERLHTLSL